MKKACSFFTVLSALFVSCSTVFADVVAGPEPISLEGTSTAVILTGVVAVLIIIAVIAIRIIRKRKHG